jgi:hypothetical protein
MILRCMSPEVALFGHAALVAECPLLKDERTKLRRGPRPEFEPTRTFEVRAA